MRLVWLVAALGLLATNERPFLQSELVFPLEHWHNHASMIVELPNGDLLVDWFHGSGERTADDVVIRGARLKKDSRSWSEPFLLADTPGYPDTNATMFIDPKRRLRDSWPTILAHEWLTALMAHKIASDYPRDGAPRWDVCAAPPTTPGADAVLFQNDVFLIPDILANAGGVTVSYFEWVQSLQSFFWEEAQVNQHLEKIMTRSFHEVRPFAKKFTVHMRTAAYLPAVCPLAEATRTPGINP